MKRTMAAKVLLAAGTASVALLTTACEVEEGTGDVEEPLLEEDTGLDDGSGGLEEGTTGLE